MVSTLNSKSKQSRQENALKYKTIHNSPHNSGLVSKTQSELHYDYKCDNLLELYKSEISEEPFSISLLPSYI